MLINPEQTKDLIDKYFKSKEKSVIFKLDTQPELQLTFIEKVLQGRKQNEPIDDDIIDRYIFLLCQSSDKKKRKEVLTKLKEYTYTPNCLIYCQKYKIKDAWAYLEEKFGSPENIDKAIELTFEVSIV